MHCKMLKGFHMQHKLLKSVRELYTYKSSLTLFLSRFKGSHPLAFKERNNRAHRRDSLGLHTGMSENGLALDSLPCQPD